VSVIRRRNCFDFCVAVVQFCVKCFDRQARQYCTILSYHRQRIIIYYYSDFRKYFAQGLPFDNFDRKSLHNVPFPSLLQIASPNDRDVFLKAEVYRGHNICICAYALCLPVLVEFSRPTQRACR
jgi:hypothetical protein